MSLAKRLLAILVAGIVAVGCGGAVARTTAARTASATRARWTALVQVNRPLDVAGPLRDGSFVVAAAGHLMRLVHSGPACLIGPYAPGYISPGGEEPYVTLPARGHPWMQLRRRTPCTRCDSPAVAA